MSATFLPRWTPGLSSRGLRRRWLLAPAFPVLLVLTGCPPEDPPPDPDVAPEVDPVLEAWASWAPLLDARLVDLTHPFDEETLVWPTSDEFEKQEVFAGRTPEGYYYEAYNIFSPEHGGTHLDAPIHFMEERWRADEIPVDRLVGPGAVVHLPEADEEAPNYEASVEDFQAWEDEHGSIPEGAVVLLAYHRSEDWPDGEAYMGTDARGEEAIADLEFPGLAPDAASWLAEERGVAAVGIDTPSIDHGPSEMFEAHQNLFEHNVLVFENVANLEDLPATGALILALPMKVGGGSGGPLRIVAALDE